MSEYEVVTSFSEDEAERQFETLQESINPLLVGDIEPARSDDGVVVTHDIAVEIYDDVGGWDVETVFVLRSGPDIYRILFVRGSPVVCLEAVLDDLEAKFGVEVSLRIIAANEQFTQEFLEHTSHRTLYPTGTA